MLACLVSRDLSLQLELSCYTKPLICLVQLLLETSFFLQLTGTLTVTKLLEDRAQYSQLAPQQGLAECCIVELDIVCNLLWLLFFIETL